MGKPRAASQPPPSRLASLIHTMWTVSLRLSAVSLLRGVFVFESQGAQSRHPMSVQTEQGHSRLSFIPGQPITNHRTSSISFSFIHCHFPKQSPFSAACTFCAAHVFTAFYRLHILLLDILSPSPQPTLCGSDFSAVWLRAVPFAPVDSALCSLSSLCLQV